MNLGEMDGGWSMLRDWERGKEEFLKNPTCAPGKTVPRWNPYSFEGGTIAGIAGDNFVVIASDTRMTFNETAPMTRDAKKLYVMNDNVMFGGCMFQGDILALNRYLKARLMRYEFNYREGIRADAFSEMLARMLYSRRFFPFYAWTVVGGIDTEGKGAVYSYDPVGCVERVPYVSAGSGRDMIDPLFDNQIKGLTQKQRDEMGPLTLERAEALMKTAFRAASKRETGTGDKIHMVTMVAGKEPVQKKFPLLED